jgi:hypothetical protein
MQTSGSARPGTWLITDPILGWRRSTTSAVSKQTGNLIIEADHPQHLTAHISYQVFFDASPEYPFIEPQLPTCRTRIHRPYVKSRYSKCERGLELGTDRPKLHGAIVTVVRRTINTSNQHLRGVRGSIRRSCEDGFPRCLQGGL